MTVEFNTLNRLCSRYKDDYKQAINRVIDSAHFILGKELDAFEERFASFCGAKYCVGLNSGLDALTLSLRALGIGCGDDVIVSANTYIASVIAITQNRAKPVFVEPDVYYCIDADRIESAITPHTKAIMPVHLYGQTCNMEVICKIAKQYNLLVVEDCAQSHSAQTNGRMTGAFGAAGCFSFYPTKNLGAFGDAGAVVTDDETIADKLRMMRNYGSKNKYYNEIEGVNSRMDELQAAVLSTQLSHIAELTEERIRIADRYINGITNEHIILPKKRAGASNVYHLFVVRSVKRDALRQYLLSNGVKTQIHYPIPPHLADCYKHLGYANGSFPVTEQYASEMLSLPLFYGMTEDETDYVIDALNRFSIKDDTTL